MSQFMPKWFMVFDVESIGLHGEGFAVGWVIVDREWNELESGCHACDPIRANGPSEGFNWAEKNIPVPQSGYNCKYPSEVRTAFWNAWLRAKIKYPGIVLAADCAWPVEARFLANCVDDNLAERELQGPYPLHEIVSFLAAAGMDPMKTYPRKPNELPVHDPLADARQSASGLMAAITHTEELDYFGPV